MRKTQNKKLTLHRETIRLLEARDLVQAKGGTVLEPLLTCPGSHCYSCDTLTAC